MAGMMGGRAAEELFIGEISTGAANDLRQATEVARAMVRDYGMSSLGPVALSEERASPFLRSAGVLENRSYSETTARQVDEEVRRMVGEALERARMILREHRDRVQAVAARLLSAEVVDEDELERLLGPKAIANDNFHPEARQELSAHPAGDASSVVPSTSHLTGPRDS